MKLPEIILPSGLDVDYVEFSIRDSQDKGVNATYRHMLHFNDLTFEVPEYVRYEGVIDGEELEFPPLVIKQGTTGKNIIRAGDMFDIEFKTDLPLSWVGTYESDKYFDIQVGDESRLELTYLGDSIFSNLIR